MLRAWEGESAAVLYRVQRLGCLSSRSSTYAFGLCGGVGAHQAELEPGDIILRVDDTLINSGADFAAACAGKTYMQV